MTKGLEVSNYPLHAHPEPQPPPFGVLLLVLSGVLFSGVVFAVVSLVLLLAPSFVELLEA